VGDKIKVSSNKPYLLRAIHEWILDNDLTPHLLVNATAANVEVPVKFVQNGQIILNIAPHAISNFHMDNEAASFSARFSGIAETLYIPIQAIQAIYASENGEGLSFPEEKLDEDHDEQDLEHELEPVPEQEQTQEKSDTSNPKDKQPPFLKVIK